VHTTRQERLLVTAQFCSAREGPERDQTVCRALRRFFSTLGKQAPSEVSKFRCVSGCPLEQEFQGAESSQVAADVLPGSQVVFAN
jgi:hypothetical protein